ncbi:hypothetical protein NNJEOMEG_00535 [Fundidesulfovibrio magnetotacticus]|uniref:Glycosyltransferase RgtA/B/C/D-like domain-containing protein n=1 Tax=Fundidesulfovibrio magnetotacticus TaxID=2730080 RepID=A0A6V8LRF3_9BACT|nr:glycosyltransferase family 39 protein [Fundidesulfovibrio magnetotacticus]GFK92709.1 hypothetical protein NNJEOMEG_00535 [Fundidesulfovibrio magnetotacticus]
MRERDIIFGRDRLPGENDLDFPLAAVLILAVGAALRFWALGAPSLWTDEILVVQNASKSWEYILDLSLKVEVHPPFYYYLYKILLLFGASDFWLRLPSALGGTLTLLALWRVGERHLGGRFAALAAMALLTVHPLHIWISRQVRPYALMGLFFTLGLGCLLNYLSEGRSRDSRRNLLANLPVAFAHYGGLLALAAQWCAAAASSVLRGIPSLSSVAGYGLGAVLCASPAAVFLWEAKFGRHDAVLDAGKGFAAALAKVAAALEGVLAFGAVWPWAWAATALLVLAGSASLALRRNPAAFLLVVFAAPPLALVAVQYASHLYPVHLCFLLPVAMLLAAEGLDLLAPRPLCRPWFALLVCMSLGGVFTWVWGSEYYTEKGVVATWWNMGSYREAARTLRANFASGDMAAFHDLNLFEGLNWYTRQMGGDGLPAGQRLDPAQESVRAVLVTNYVAFGHLFDGEASFRYLFGESAAVARVGGYRFYQAVLGRSPRIPLASGGVSVGLTADPRDVWARAWSLRDLTVSPYFGCDLVPTRERSPGEVVYLLETQGEDAPSPLVLLADFALLAPGNRLAVDCRFDDGPWNPLLDERDPAGETSLLARVQVPGPYRQLWLRATLLAGATHADNGAGALGQVRLRRLTLLSEDSNARFLSRTLDVREEGLDKLESLPGGLLMRWATGRSAAMSFVLPQDGPLRLEYRFTNRIPGQRVEILHDGEPVSLHEDLAPGQEVAESMTLPGRAGQGRVEFRFARANHQDAESTFSPGDPRALAVGFLDLSLETPDLPAAFVPPKRLPR